MVTVTAKKRFWYGGRDVVPGPVEMHAADAAAYARKGLVSLAKQPKSYRTTAMTADLVMSTPSADFQPANMRADVVLLSSSLTEATITMSQPVVGDTPNQPAVPRAKRTYRRRDMTVSKTEAE